MLRRMTRIHSFCMSCPITIGPTDIVMSNAVPNDMLLEVLGHSLA